MEPSFQLMDLRKIIDYYTVWRYLAKFFGSYSFLETILGLLSYELLSTTKYLNASSMDDSFYRRESSWFSFFVFNPYPRPSIWPSRCESRARTWARRRTRPVVSGEHTWYPNLLFHRRTISPCRACPGTAEVRQNRPVNYKMKEFVENRWNHLGRLKLTTRVFWNFHTYLARVFASVRISSAYHPVGDVELFDRDPEIAGFSLQHWDLNFVHS